MGVGLRLKEILRDKKMTIKELAEISGISVNTLYSITKRDSNRVDDVILQRIAKVLGIHCADEIRSGDLDQAIQQLTAENARLKSELSDLQHMHDRLHDFETAAYEQATEKIKKLKAEIERLARENTQLKAQLKLLTDKPSDNGY